MPIAENAVVDWLDTHHPIYDAFLDRWTENERRLLGGDYVLDELRRFKWETLPGQAVPDEQVGQTLVAGEHYVARQREATYLNFPEAYALGLKGHLLRKRPLPEQGLSFGSLGLVRRDRDLARPTLAEILYYNTDGIGTDGSQWDNVWLDTWVRATATGHRWQMVEVPEVSAQNEQDVLDGLRPYLVEFSPQQVPNWYFDRGRLDWAIVRVSTSRPTVVDGKMENNDAQDGFMLMVRKGVADLGDDFRGGGWWLFDENKKYIGKTGTWDMVRGDIPLWPLYYQRDRGVAGRKDTKSTQTTELMKLLITRGRTARSAMSRPAVTELGQLAISYMNLSSAADYDAWDAASSLVFLLGIDKNAYNIAASVWASGSQIVPVPMGDGGQTPTIGDGSAGAVTAQVFSDLLGRKLREADRIAVQEISSAPDSSGLSKEAGFHEQKSPRLANVASELEQAQNIAIHFFELRFGKTEPRGSVSWPREFNVVDVIKDIRDFLDTQKVAGVSSKTLTSNLMIRGAKERGFITDAAIEKTVLDEYVESAVAAETRAAALNTLTQDIGA
jgi:hypothetical protein